MQGFINTSTRFAVVLFCGIIFNYSTCKYGFKDVSPIPAEVKTFRVNYLENKSQYTNSQLSPQLTEKVKQKIIGNTRLRYTNNDDAHYDISGYISQYYVTTVAITNNQSSGNRLNVGFHLSFKNTLDPTKNQEADILRTYPFPAQQSLTQAESELTTKMVSDITDDIFNKIFSNW